MRGQHRLPPVHLMSMSVHWMSISRARCHAALGTNGLRTAGSLRCFTMYSAHQSASSALQRLRLSSLRASAAWSSAVRRSAVARSASLPSFRMIFRAVPVKRSGVRGTAPPVRSGCGRWLLVGSPAARGSRRGAFGIAAGPVRGLRRLGSLGRCRRVILVAQWSSRTAPFGGRCSASCCGVPDGQRNQTGYGLVLFPGSSWLLGRHGCHRLTSQMTPFGVADDALWAKRCHRCRRFRCLYRVSSVSPFGLAVRRPIPRRRCRRLERPKRCRRCRRLELCT